MGVGGVEFSHGLTQAIGVQIVASSIEGEFEVAEPLLFERFHTNTAHETVGILHASEGYTLMDNIGMAKLTDEKLITVTLMYQYHWLIVALISPSTQTLQKGQIRVKR